MSEKEKTMASMPVRTEIGRAIETKAGRFDYLGAISPIEDVQPMPLHLLVVRRAIRIPPSETNLAPFPNQRGYHEEAIIRDLVTYLPQVIKISGRGTYQAQDTQGEQTVHCGDFIFELKDGQKEEVVFFPTRKFGESIHKLLIVTAEKLGNGFVLEKRYQGNSFPKEMTIQEYKRLFED